MPNHRTRILKGGCTYSVQGLDVADLQSFIAEVRSFFSLRMPEVVTVSE